MAPKRFNKIVIIDTLQTQTIFNETIMYLKYF